jgi:uncharacterized protein YkwD
MILGGSLRILALVLHLLLIGCLHARSDEGLLVQSGALANGSSVAIVPQSLSVNTEDRAEVVRFYDTVYRASEEIQSQWNGDRANCIAGEIATEYQQAMLQRINFLRAMAGLPGNITINHTWSSQCQEAALMFSAEGKLSHQPPSSWSCYSTDAAQAAAKSNISIGREGPAAIDSFVDDPGLGNYFVGHRRWMLYPPQQVMGVGSVPAAPGYFAAACVWVTSGFGTRPAKPDWVAWPPPGYVPYRVMPRWSNRWSFSYPKADFSEATVTMENSGVDVPVTIEPLENNRGYGDNTMVWKPKGVPLGRPQTDLTYSVSISNVVVQGEKRQFNYQVTIIDPEPALAFSSVTRDAKTVTLTWARVAILQIASQPDGPWQDAPDAPASPHTIAAGDPAAFFRLKSGD